MKLVYDFGSGVIVVLTNK